MKFRISKKPGFRKRVSAILGIACCLSMLIGTLAYFTDRVNISTTSVIGTMDLVFDDISASRSGANGILSPNEFAIDGIWGRSLVQEGSIINPGDYFDLSFNISNEGNKSMDLRQRITLTSTVPMTGNEYVLSIDGLDDESLVGVLSDDGLTLTYELPEVILNGTGTGAEIEDGISASAKDYIVRLDFTGNAGNAFQGSGVTVTLDAQAKQHRNTDDNDWVDWANYKTGIEQVGDQYVSENVPMLAPTSTWFSNGKSGIKRSSITEIEIVDTYTPTGKEDATWDASDPSVPGTVTAYVEGTKLTIAGNGYSCIYANPDSTSAFADPNYADFFSNVTSFKGLELLNTSKAIYMTYMFDSMSKITSLDGVSKFDTSNVVEMVGTFYYCTSLESLDLNLWDVGNVKYFTSTFANCGNLQSLKVRNWDTSSAISMESMFCACSSLESLDVANWDTGNVQSFKTIFASKDHAANMQFAELDVEKWDTSSATDMSGMFYGCSKITSLNLSKWDVSKVTDMNHMFCDCKSLTSFSFDGWETDSLTNISNLFNSCESLTVVDVSDLDTSKVLSLQSVFVDCHNLETIVGLENFDTSLVGTGEQAAFYAMFLNCYKLTSLDLSSFDTSKATNMESMFKNCNALTTIYVGDGWDISNLTKSTHMFYKCNSLVGGAGSAYATLSNSGKTYAKVDGGSADPGYLTYKAVN